MHEPTLISATETTPSEIMFRVPTPVDLENDQYDSESHSWQQGDELGLAITTSEDFDFNFDPEQVIQSSKVMQPAKSCGRLQQCTSTHGCSCTQVCQDCQSS